MHLANASIADWSSPGPVAPLPVAAVDPEAEFPLPLLVVATVATAGELEPRHEATSEAVLRDGQSNDDELPAVR
jgi:hypothetical protein